MSAANVRSDCLGAFSRNLSNHLKASALTLSDLPLTWASRGSTISEYLTGCLQGASPSRSRISWRRARLALEGK